MNKETKEAVENSIKHWEKDFIARFKKGDCISSSRWLSDSSRIKWGSHYCSLCELFWLDGEDCNKECPLNIIGKGCLDDNHSSPYHNFSDNPCLETAETMVQALKETLRSEKI